MTRTGAPEGAIAVSPPSSTAPKDSPAAAATLGAPNGKARACYADVGVALRAAYARAVAGDLGERDWRVFGAIIVLSASWSRLSDQTSIRQVAALAYGLEYDAVTGWARRKTGDTLRRLARLGVIGYRPGSGRLSRCTVSLETGPLVGAIPLAKQPPPWARNSPHRGRETAPADAATPSSKSENSSEGEIAPSCSTPARGSATEEEIALRETTKGRIAARWSDHFGSPRFTFRDALSEIDRFEDAGLELIHGIDETIGYALERAVKPQYVINALELKALRQRVAV